MMEFNITIDKKLEEKLNQIKKSNFREYTIITKKIEEIREHSKIMLNHKTKFNTFDKPLQDYKWIEINDKILIFKIEVTKKEIHFCEYLTKDEVFQ